MMAEKDGRNIADNRRIKNVKAVYFSGTGTTELVVSKISEAAAERLGAVCHLSSFNQPAARSRDWVFDNDDLVVFGVPVYAGRVPNLLLPFLNSRLKGGGASAIPVVLFGNRAFDDALAELYDILVSAGFHIAGAGAFVGEHVFTSALGKGRPDERDIAMAAELGMRAAEKAEAIRINPEAEYLKYDLKIPGNHPAGSYYTPRDLDGNPVNILKAHPKTDEMKCVSCGLCAELCPLGSIDFENPSEMHGICMKCGACIKRCPAGAKYIDDPAYLRHIAALEKNFTGRAESRIFL